MSHYTLGWHDQQNKHHEIGEYAEDAWEAVRNAGYIVNRVIAIVDRQENHKVWDNNEIEFISLFTLEDIINE